MLQLSHSHDGDETVSVSASELRSHQAPLSLFCIFSQSPPSTEPPSTSSSSPISSSKPDTFFSNGGLYVHSNLFKTSRSFHFPTTETASFLAFPIKISCQENPVSAFLFNGPSFKSPTTTVLRHLNLASFKTFTKSESSDTRTKHSAFLLSIISTMSFLNSTSAASGLSDTVFTKNPALFNSSAKPYPTSGKTSLAAFLYFCIFIEYLATNFTLLLPFADSI
uniref:Uncharacterized protein n=1 Tax=Cucumis sativus TaxID=3659 RepID=A0A0A0L1P9_CUCSA